MVGQYLCATNCHIVDLTKSWTGESVFAVWQSGENTHNATRVYG